MTTDIFCFYLKKNGQSKPVKQEVNGTAVLPPLVFLALTLSQNKLARFELKKNFSVSSLPAF
jgi:hypothetical protein